MELHKWDRVSHVQAVKSAKDVKQIGKMFFWTILDSPYKQERCLVKLANETILLFWEEKNKIPVTNKDGKKDNMTLASI